jgi:hypothetical protein
LCSFCPCLCLCQGLCLSPLNLTRLFAFLFMSCSCPCSSLVFPCRASPCLPLSSLVDVFSLFEGFCIRSCVGGTCARLWSRRETWKLAGNRKAKTRQRDTLSYRILSYVIVCIVSYVIVCYRVYDVCYRIFSYLI